MHSIQTFAARIGQLMDALKGNVAGRLKEMGYKGLRKSDDSCPLANYFRQNLQLPEGARVSVGRQFVTIRNVDGGAITLTDELREFVMKFDSGEYPELIQQ